MLSVHCMVRFDFIVVLSVRKRHDLVCPSLLCRPMVDTKTPPLLESSRLWAISDISDPCWVRSLDAQVWTSPVWSRGQSQP